MERDVVKVVGPAPSALRLPLIAASVVFACAAGGAARAGNIEPLVEPVVMPAELTIWEGFYVGGSIAYAFSGDDEVGHSDPAGRLLVSPSTLEQHGVNYGLRLGWRGQRAMTDRAFVYGIELGYDIGEADDSFDVGGYSASVEMNNVISVRLKSGFTNKAGDTLFYGILGYVRGDFDYAVAGTTAGDTIALDTTFESDGFSVGLGVEHMLNDRWTVNLEWEYLEFGSERLYDGGGSSTRATPKYNNIRVGVNYRF